MKTLYAYILTNRSRTLYIGVTNDIVRRLHEHRGRRPGSFSARYRIDRLVYVEAVAGPMNAIRREKELKGWVRRRKIALIDAWNPTWRDLGKLWRPDDRPPEPDPSLRSG